MCSLDGFTNLFLEFFHDFFKASYFFLWNNLLLLFSSNFCNLVFGWFWEVTKILLNSLFNFILSCLANGKHCTENHATKVMKTPKTKLPKYVMNWAKIGIFSLFGSRSKTSKQFRIREPMWWARYKSQISITYEDNRFTISIKNGFPNLTTHYKPALYKLCQFNA